MLPSGPRAWVSSCLPTRHEATLPGLAPSLCLSVTPGCSLCEGPKGSAGGRGLSAERELQLSPCPQPPHRGQGSACWVTSLPLPAGKAEGWTCDFVGSYHKHQATSGCFSEDGSLLAVSFEETVTVWESGTWELRCTFCQRAGRVRWVNGVSTCAPRGNGRLSEGPGAAAEPGREARPLQ